MDLWRLLHQMWCNWTATQKHISGMINYFGLQLIKYIPRIFSLHVLYSNKITVTEQSTKFVKIYVRKTKEINTLFPLFVSILLSSTCFKQTSISSEVTSVKAAYSILHACVWCLITNTLYLKQLYAVCTEVTPWWWTCLFETCTG
jgi:hypothetical protein